ncbi:MAG: hypothetical protein GX786_05895, partial [Clostridiales bacterium]|nr:hypothetical protein [Clostridiales bacterium]
FIEDGWTLEDGDLILSPYQQTYSASMSKDQKNLNVRLTNLGIDELPAKECLITHIDLTQEAAEKSAFSFEIAKKITFGSSAEELEAAYGVPGYTYEGTSYDKWEYSTDTYNKVSLYLSNDTKSIYQIEMSFVAVPQGYNDEAEAAEVEVPAIVSDYTPSSELGEDLLSFNAIIDDVIYSFPVSYQYMEENGWALATKDSKKLAAKDSIGNITLLYKGGYKTSARFYNLSTKANLLENCFISTLTFEEGFPGKVELPGGITLGMSQEDLIKALDAFALEDDVLDVYESDSYTSYTVKRKVLEEISIYIDTKTNAVYKIEISNRQLGK